MFKILVTAPVASKSILSVGLAEKPQTGFQLEPTYGTPKFGSRSLENLIKPPPGNASNDPSTALSDNTSAEPSTTSDTTLENNSSVAQDSNVANQLNTKGESVQDVTDSTSILLALDKKAEDPAPDSFIASSWPYFLIAFALLGWVIIQIRKKPAPSYKHHTIVKKQATETGPKLTGEFKVSQRFQNKETDEADETETVETETDESQTSSDETDKDELSLAKDKPPQAQEATPENADRPSDDEFDVDFDGGVSDSDVIDEKEAAEIIARVDAGHTGIRKPRFKTEIGKKNAAPKDRV
ncbi:hypothetical protein N9Y42_05865 [Mariniblastus sp.]|nr:hypothetical protein [Mariniblastus sp.]